MKKMISLFVLVSLIVTLSACSGDSAQLTLGASASQAAASQAAASQAAASQAAASQAAASQAAASQTTTTLEEKAATAVTTQQTSAAALSPISVSYDQDDLNPVTGNSAMSYIKLDGDSIAFEGNGAMVNGANVFITSAGVYNISGRLNNGQIIVETQDEETVVLVLNGADITCLTSAPIYISHAEKTVVTLADGSENRLTDGASYVFENPQTDEPNAALFSKDDLTINGNGDLTVNANYNNGIVSKDKLKITSGSISVNAVNDGIKGRDFVAVQNGTINVNAGGDGIQSNNDEDVEKGYVSIEGGKLNITAGMDGIQAETRLLVSGGALMLASGGGSLTGHTSDNSAKGLKAGLDISITDGVVQIDSADDAIHSNGSLTMSGGEILLASGDDGLHSDASLEINGGEVRITQSYEGIESAIITINAGAVYVVASDDGINAGGGGDGSSVNGRPGQNAFEVSGDYKLYVNGGYIVVDASGDGIDINGPIDMTGGVVLVNGPTDNGNGPLDYTGAFNISGGFLVAVGSSGMAQAPSASSTQYSVLHTFPSSQAAGALIHIQAEDGQDILTMMPTKNYQSVVLSSPELKNGSTYLVYSGGSSSGAATDGLYSGGSYTAGAQVASFTISSIVTGAAQGGFPGGGPGGGPGAPPPGRP